MGRLFWKFFFFFWLAQLATAIGVGGMIWLKARAPDQAATRLDGSPPASFAVAAAAATLRHGGEGALRELMAERGREPAPPVFAVDEKQRELLGRTVPAGAFVQAQQLAEERGGEGMVARVGAHGHVYLLFVLAPPQRRAGDDGHPPPMHPSPPPPRMHAFPPLMPLLAGGWVSLVFAAWLAWYFSRPIRSLRAAFESAAAGNLDVRLAPKMGQRRDELADLGRDFDRMAERLRSLMDGQRRLLHDVSHEMRSPLARMQAAIGLARQQPERMDSSLARIERESVRMDKLISELLTLSRLEAGMAGKPGGDVDVDELLLGIVEDARLEAAAKACEIRFEPRVRAIVRGEAEWLHRAVENVVRNAVRHAPAGSAIHIETAWGDDGSLHLAVSDEGAGVAEAEMASIFTPFFRGSAARSSDGHGLGLAISHRIVEAHGGSIRAANQAGGGLRVTISLPVRSGRGGATPDVAPE